MTLATSNIAHDLRAACMRITRRVRLQATSIPPHWFTVLAALDNGVKTATELAEREQVSAPSMSRTVKELEDRGMVSRAVDEDDRRARILTITEVGLKALHDGRRSRDHWMVERVRSCTPEEQKILAEATTILNRLLEN
ncbi:MarR family winged helix-turn-helix transcriptional regulator [Aestuariimicrobium soli]|uniref:MarR family winged helix-turn-helix transcriptional regulator n=1 Tax=Aestuariimicrobium soli TaxID=2035834 RepID=UPI003EBFA39A